MLNSNGVFLCCISWLSVICVNGFGYYKLIYHWPPQDVFWANDFCASYCHLSYLASANSVQQAITITDLCQEPPSLCWIGLVLHINSADTKISYTWFDQTSVDENVINKFWCDNFPIFNNNFQLNNTVSYVFINGSCWENTYISNNTSPFISKWICGPSRNKPLEYWITEIAVPMVLLLIVFIYSSYFLGKLVYNLYIFEHNWIIEPSHKVKVSAILTMVMAMICSISGSIYFILYIYMWAIYDMIMPDTLPPYEYPQIYWFAFYLAVLSVVTAILGSVCGYFNILLRLHHACNKNVFIKSVIRCNCCFYFIGFMISILPIGFGLICFKNILPVPLPTVFVIITISDLLYINTSLLYYYSKGLHEYAHKHYFRYDVARENQNTHMMDDRIHELMLEATRYVVLFGAVVITDITVGLYAAVWFLINHRRGYFFRIIGSILLEFVMLVQMIIFLQSIYLSFKFNHDKYEKKCYYNYANRCVLEICNKIVKQRHQRTINKRDQNCYHPL